MAFTGPTCTGTVGTGTTLLALLTMYHQVTPAIAAMPTAPPTPTAMPMVAALTPVDEPEG